MSTVHMNLVLGFATAYVLAFQMTGKTSTGLIPVVYEANIKHGTHNI